MKGVALRLSLPPFVKLFVSLRQVNRLSNLPLLIFCDTHTDTLSANVVKVRPTAGSHAFCKAFKSSHCLKLTSSTRQLTLTAS